MTAPLTLCATEECEVDATHLVTWPTTRTKPCCLRHAELQQRIGRAIGLRVKVEPIPSPSPEVPHAA